MNCGVERKRKMLVFWSHHFRPYVVSLVLFWTFLISVLLWHEFSLVEEAKLRNALSETNGAFNKDLLYRRWVTGHGGVYVPITEETPPNPYLSHVEERDIATPSGKRLTLINPAYMTRQVHELSKSEYGIRGHITSLIPIRPENAPDPWEKAALEAFERGEAKISSVEIIDGKAHMRMMKPFITEVRCLICHAEQGYSEGDIRGGISVSTPMAPHVANAKTIKTTLQLEFIIIWLIGLLGIAAGNRRIQKYEKRRNAAEKELRKHQEYLEQLVEKRTEDLKRTNEELESEIAEHKRDEEGLRDSEVKYRELYEGSLDGFVHLSMSGRILESNEAFQTITGYSAEELHKLTYHDLTPEKWRQKNAELLHVVLNNGYSPLLQKEYRRKDGNAISVELREYLQKDQKGNPTGIWASVRDITESKQAKEKIMEKEHLNQILLDGFPGFVMLQRVSTREVVIANKIARDGGAVPCTQCFSTLGQREDPCPWCLAPEVWETGKSQHVQTWGLGILWDAYWVPVTEDLYLHFAFDITERNQLEEERIKASKLESIGVLAGGIAHDFNNILTIINGNIMLASLVAKNDVGKCKELLEISGKACIRAADLTRQLLTFSRGGEPEKKTFCIKEPFVQAVEFALKGSNVKKELELPDEPCLVEADEAQLTQVFNNLVINANQAMPEGGTITVKVENVSITAKNRLPIDAGRYVKMTIKDQGIGITEEHLSKIFDPYFSTKQEGSGLGLATTYSIIKKHGGYITAESELKVGTTFHIYLPASREQVKEKEGEKKKGITVNRGKILVMDDEQALCDVISSLLEHMGHEVESTNDGTQAEKMYSEAIDSGQPFDAVILDLTIPGGMGGKETIKQLLEIDPDVKAIVSSGYSNDPVVAHFKDYGFSSKVSKPCQIEELQEVLQSVMKKKNG
jgi:PAS domain S-box-containing protein